MQSATSTSAPRCIGGGVGPSRARGVRSARVVVVHAASNPEKRRVVITGLGVVSSVGHTPDEFYDNLLDGKSGIREIQGFEHDDAWATTIAGEIDAFDVSEYVTRKQARRLDKSLLYTIVSGKRALADAGLPLHADAEQWCDPMRAGILIGTALGGMKSFAASAEVIAKGKGHRKFNPFCIPMSILNMGGAMMAMETGFMGPNYAINTACATGNYCLLNSYNHIARGGMDIMLAGASESCIIPEGIGGFIACKALSKRNDDPQGASRPWDKNRDGFVMGEGAGVLVLEELEHAKARGARIYAELKGGAYTTDAYHMTDPRPDGSGVARCIANALESSGVSADEVGYVNAHATSTLAGDLAEYRAITGAITHDNLRINGTKSMIGHLLGGASGVEGVATVMALARQKLHPNLNLADPEEEVSMDILVGAEAQEHSFTHAISNSFGFGGHNSAVIFGTYDE